MDWDKKDWGQAPILFMVILAGRFYFIMRVIKYLQTQLKGIKLLLVKNMGIVLTLVLKISQLN